MKRRTMIAATSSAAAVLSTSSASALAAGDQSESLGTQVSRPSQRMGARVRFADADMDLFYMAAAGWGPSGGLDLGQIHYVASKITDGDADSWIKAFSDYGDLQLAQADHWAGVRWRQEASEARMKAFAAYRSAWQFSAPGEEFARLFMRHRTVFAQAVAEARLPATFFKVPYAGKTLPGVYFQNADAHAPVVLIIGGADTSFEDLFLTLGRNLFGRGFSVALVDLPGQGITMLDGLSWEAEAEKSIAAVSDVLVERFSAIPGRMALVGLSLGGYFVARAAGAADANQRWATVMASSPFPNPAKLFALSFHAAAAEDSRSKPSPASMRSRMITLWKAGAATPADFIPRTAGMVADPSKVTLPFLSIVGAGDSQEFVRQAQDWHAGIRSQRKAQVVLDAATGADAHVQVNNRLRLAQECAGWMGDIFGARDK